MSPRPRPSLRHLVPLFVAALVATGCAATDGEPVAGDDVGATDAGSSPAEAGPVPTAVGTSTEPPVTIVTGEAAPSSTSTTPSPTTTSDPTDAPGEPRSAGCRRLTDLDGADADRWIVVNDGVMGGQSTGTVEFDGSAMRFSGTVITDGGGFTSVRLPIDGELAGTDRIELRLRPDDRTYAVTMETDSRVGGRLVSYGAELSADPPPDAGGWSIATVPYDELRTTIFGSPVEAPPFDADRATEVGIIIADGVDGDFAIDVDLIDACR